MGTNNPEPLPIRAPRSISSRASSRTEGTPNHASNAATTAEGTPLVHINSQVNGNNTI